MPARILYVENGLGFGGATRCLHTLVAGAMEHGFEPFVAIAYDDPELRGLIEPARIINISRFHRFGANSRRANGGWKVWSRIGGRLCGSARGLFNKMVRDRPHTRFLARWMAVRDIALVHTNNGLLANRAEIEAAWLAGVPVIAHQRGWEWACALSRALARKVSGMVAISDAVGENLRRIAPNRDSVTRVYDGIDVRHFAPHAERRAPARRRFGLSDGDFVVGFLAAHLAWKGHDVFLRTLAGLCREHEHLKAVVAGSRPAHGEALRPAPHELAEALGLRDRVVWLDHVLDPAEVYAACDVVAHASVEPEPLGLVVLEAMACGLPVVASRAGGPTETVLDGITGILVPGGDPGAMGSAIESLVLNPGLRREMGMAARARAVERFDLRTGRREIIKLYDALIARHEPSAPADSSWPYEPSYS